MNEWSGGLGPQAEPPMVRGGLLWALALYIPISGPLQRFEESLAQGPLSKGGQQVVLMISSLLLALAVGLVLQLLLSWTLGPGWGSSLALIKVGWSLFLVLGRREQG
jgi:hypothetical protein